MPAEASMLCIDGTIGSWVTGALERASLRSGFDTASRRKAVVAVTLAAPVRGAPPLAEGRGLRRTAPQCILTRTRSTTSMLH